MLLYHKSIRYVEVRCIWSIDWVLFVADTVYLDNAGSALYAKSHLTAYHTDLLSNVYSNPHSHHQTSLATADVIDYVRDRSVCQSNKGVNVNQNMRLIGPPIILELSFLNVPIVQV